MSSERVAGSNDQFFGGSLIYISLVFFHTNHEPWDSLVFTLVKLHFSATWWQQAAILHNVF